LYFLFFLFFDFFCLCGALKMGNNITC
jgi:hypothetical protein